MGTVDNMNTARVVTVVVVVVMVMMMVEGQRNRKKPKDKKKDLFWFKVAENSTSSCENVDEDSLTETVVEGPPADSCQVDEERWCFCGKKGSATTTTWKYMCGECKENKPFSFKIERGKVLPLPSLPFPSLPFPSLPFPSHPIPP